MREYFCAYHSLRNTVEKLSDAEKGRLFMGCLEYSETGIAPDFRGNERFVFPGIREQIDRDKEKYERVCEIRRESGRIGGEANASKCYQMVAKGSKCYQDKDKDKDKYIPPPISPHGGKVERFAEFWEAYPKKVGKGAALKAWEYKSSNTFSRITSAVVMAIKSGCRLADCDCRITSYKPRSLIPCNSSSTTK